MVQELAVEIGQIDQDDVTDRFRLMCCDINWHASIGRLQTVRQGIPHRFVDIGHRPFGSPADLGQIDRNLRLREGVDEC